VYPVVIVAYDEANGASGNTMSSLRKLIVFICIAAIVCVAFGPVSSGLLWAALVPLLLFVEAVVITLIKRPTDEGGIPAFPCLAVLASRAPPAR
jgi:hypothetical protein